MCRLLEVSASGYYAWRARPASARDLANTQLSEQIRHFHAASHGTYGAPRIRADLADAGQHVGTKRVAGLMKAAGLAGVSRRRSTVTTRREVGSEAASDLVQRDFSVAEPDRPWVADITYVPTWAGFIYLAVVLDAFSRRVVGWSMATRLRTELVTAALSMAVHQRRPTDVIHHSDKGCQYTSIAFGARCKEAGIRPSTGTAGDCYDNAMCESFFATLECELLDRRPFPSHVTARMAIFSFIEGFYNPRRRHSRLGVLSPVEFERSHTVATLHSQAAD